MSIYRENLRSFKLLKRIPRILYNAFYMFRSGDNASKPFGIKFEVASLCNLRCIMCPQSKGLKRKLGLLNFDNFKYVYNQINPTYLNLTGIGEPLLNPDLFKIIKYAKTHGSVVKLDTNVTLLNKDKILALLSSGVDIVSASIDGVNKSSYEKIRVGAKFEKVIENFKKLIYYRNNLKSQTRIHINFVLQKTNISELPDFIRYIDSLGPDSINGDIALPLGSNKNIDNRKINKKSLAKLKEELKSIKTKASLNIEHTYEFLESDGEIKKKSKSHCFYPWYYPSITWDGYVVPCCYICDNEIVFGNVFETPFRDIWNNDNIKRFRRMLANKREGICKYCFIDESFIADKFKKIRNIPLIGRISKRKWK